ncbi:MAG: DUF6443 domain-containing protein [Bacteroides sp.]|nr:DUF6443 domain-containing protein [Bacteroides sp.]
MDADYKIHQDVYHYYDGLGRKFQTLQYGVTPTKKSLVTLQEYDTQGSFSASWLPAVGDFSLGAQEVGALKSSSRASNGDQNPFTSYVYEKSPLRRPLEVYEPGTAWHTNKKGVKTSYYTNLFNNDTLACTNYMILDDPDFNTVKLRNKGPYTAAELLVLRTQDEDGNASFTFKNRQEQVLLTRDIVYSGGKKVPYDTYYLYDDFGNLRVVLPPLAVDGGASATVLDQYAYLYKYDSRGNCIGKKLPGADWQYFIYDKADRLIFSQDGEERKRGQWSFSIPDELGRTVVTGVCKNTLDHTTEPLKNTLVKATFGKATNTYKGYTLSGGYPDYAYRTDGRLLR